jgi:UDP-N-acetylmuramoyl-tripeptide--D-alanyl-D-alanine ligase
MQVALENFHDLEANNKMLILGDMFEIGEDSLKEHQQVIKLALQLQFDTIILCGSFFEEANQSQTDQVLAFKNFQELANYLQIKTLKNKTILIKGSRGMALERCLANL